MLMPTTVLPQLQTIEAELASQESQIAAELASVREKLTGIRTVMPMFLGTADGAVPVVLEEVSPVSEPIVEGTAISLEEPEEGTAAVEEPTVLEAPEPTETKTKATKTKKTAQKKTPAKKTATAKETTAKETTTQKATAKKDGRAASWQKYTRPGVKNESIPDAVKLILETQPENDFKIVDVMTALFTEEIPKSQYLKARNRISNVLSGGVRAGDWYKGERGTYRMTAA